MSAPTGTRARTATDDQSEGDYSKFGSAPVRPSNSYDDIVLQDSDTSSQCLNTTTTKNNNTKEDENITNKGRSYSLDTDDDSAMGDNDNNNNKNELKSAATASASATTPTASNNAAASFLTIDSDDDEELRVAKEMAMAIAQNPNLTPSEIKELANSTKNRISISNNSSTSTSRAGKSTTGSTKSPLLKSMSKSFKSGSGKVVKGIFKSSSKKSTPPSSSSSSGVTITTTSTTAVSDAPFTLGSTDTPAAAPAALSTSASSVTHTKQPQTTGKLGAFLETSNASSNSHNSNYSGEDQDTLVTHSPSSNVRITGIVWKRRSGLGKYSVSAAWERRRIVLNGPKLMYYRTNADTNDEDASVDETMDEPEPPTPETTTTTTTSASSATTMLESTAAKGKSWLEQSFKTAALSTSSAVTTKKSARGYLDLVKDNASVGASFGHSGSPTPFALSIKILAQTKWKLCFDTQAELMHWLAALTDVIVQGSVDSYNAQILTANDPSNTIMGEFGYISYGHQGGQGQLSEPPMIASSGSKEGAGGHRLWVTGDYNIKSEDYPEPLEDISEGELLEEQEQEVVSDDDEDATVTATTRAPPPTTTTDDDDSPEGGGKDVWAIPANAIWIWGILWNVAIVLSRSSGTTVDQFWYLLTFTNICLFGVLTKEKVGRTAAGGAAGSATTTSVHKPSVVVTRKMTRRLSSAAGYSSSGDDQLEPHHNKKGAALPKQPSEKDFRPVAGTTSMRIENPQDLPVKNGHVFAGWRYADPATMPIRGHKYKTNKLKVPSPGEMYKCIHVDIFEARSRFPDMASRVVLPKVEFKNDVGPKTWNAPDIFVVSIAVPTDPPKLYSSSENGGGYTIAMYFTMHQDTREILKRVTADGYNPKSETSNDKSKVNAVRLLEEWCRRAPTDDAFAARFKVLPNAQNLKEIGMPAWISKYNGKPFLIKRPGQTGFLYRHPEKSCIEFDISLHPFPYLAKQGICFMKDTYFKKVLVTFGFLIEGRAEDELPECLIGLTQLCYPDPIHAIKGEDFMAGKSPRSFEKSK
jgi:hypothetical protein